MIRPKATPRDHYATFEASPVGIRQPAPRKPQARAGRRPWTSGRHAAWDSGAGEDGRPDPTPPSLPSVSVLQPDELDQPASASASSRSSRLRILPLALRGRRSVRTLTMVGTLKPARCALRWASRPSTSSSVPGRGDHGQGHLLAEALVGDAEHGGLVHAGVLVDGGLDLGAVDVLAGAQDHVLGPVLDVDEALVVEAAEVAGAQPAVDVDDLGGGLGLVPVAADQVRAPEPDLADLAGGDRVAVVVDDLRPA